MAKTLSPVGRFIVLEGLEGCGKTTNARCVVDYLEQHGKKVVLTREPGGTPLAESLRDLLLSVEGEAVSPFTELCLMFAARMQHVTQKIKPLLASGTWVVCDRFLDATYAYQGGGRGIDEKLIDCLAEPVCALAAPDCVLYLDIPLETSRERVAQRGNCDRFEQEGDAFFERVLSVYRQRARTGDCYKWIDAHKALDDVQSDLRAALKSHFVDELS